MLDQKHNRAYAITRLPCCFDGEYDSMRVDYFFSREFAPFVRYPISLSAIRRQVSHQTDSWISRATYKKIDAMNVGRPQAELSERGDHLFYVDYDSESS